MPSRLDTALPWVSRAVAVAALSVVAWVCVTAWGAVGHGHPAYAIWLGVTVLAAIASLLWSLRAPDARPIWFRVLRIAGLVVAALWVGITAWLRPFTAVEPALAAMESDAAVTVTESADLIVFAPTGAASSTALAFEPGARVDPRAYAAHLRPLAEAGHTVVIIKQPLGIGFLAIGGYTLAAEQDISADWVIGGHSLGGTVAALQTSDTGFPPVGLLLWGSYPAGDMSDWAGAVLSVSGSVDGLSTPAKIDASRADLPPSAAFHQVNGASHAQFGSYGLQPGDGVAYLSNDAAREEISAATLAWLDALA